MAAANIELTEEQQRVLQEADGYAEGPSYVVMSKERFCFTMGIDSEEEYQKTVQAIDRGLADIAAGRKRPFRDFLDDLRAGHGVSR